MKINKGNQVKLDYEGKLENGEIFDTSTHGDHSHPLDFEVGSGQVIKGFDDAVIGMSVGEEKEFSIEAENAYGSYDESLEKELPKNILPDGQEPEEGMVLVMATPDGQKVPVKIKKVEKDSILIDLNHPLAGKKLIFKIKILEIK